MGNTYFYGKIVSMLGNSFFGKGKDGINQMMKYMMMSEMCKGTATSGASGLNSMLPLMMLSGGSMSDMFDGMFDFGDVISDKVDDVADEIEGKE